MIGTSLGRYTIIEQLGAGGMGEVYRARDTKLERDVAIKVLPDDLAADPDRLARFEREAKLLAALNHSNIGSIHSLEETDGVHFVVLELIEGESLEQRLRNGAIPVPEAVDIARQIAEALEAAHDAGIIHRDVKPANVLLTAKGGVKVLDFGIAKSTLLDGAVDAGLTEQATSLTVDGTVMGTPPYMAPEQIRGEEADKRADVWAFGCVVYEMLAGKAAFARETVADTLVAVLEAEPDWEVLSGRASSAFTAVLRRCLRKDRNRRIRHIGDAKIEIEDAWEARFSGAHGFAASASPPGRWPGLVPWGVAFAVLAIGAAVGASAWLSSSPRANYPPPADYPIRFEITSPAFWDLEGNGVLVTPDGRRVLFGGLPEDGSEPRLHVREVGSTEAYELAEIAAWPAYPFFSSDGEWLAFRRDGDLVKAPLSGGSPTLIHELPDQQFASFQGGCWSSEGWILFSSAGALYRIPDDGSEPPTLLVDAHPELGELRHPDLLPDRSAALVTLWRNSPDDARVGIADLASGEVDDLRIDGSDPQYLPTGHLVWVRDDSVFAAPFDADRREVTGPRVRVQEGIEVGPAGPGKLSISPSGTLAYSGAGASGDFSLVWIDRNGNREAIRSGITEEIWPPRLSPDGRRIAMALGGGSYVSTRLWIYDIADETLTAPPTNRDSRVANFPVWSPDGSSLMYMGMEAGRFAVFESSVDSTGETRLVVSGTPAAVPFSFAPGGDELAIVIGEIATASDVSIVSLDTGESRVVLDDPATETAPMISPDGRWLAYVSNVSGDNQIYVRPFPGPGVPTQVSTDGGTEPRWSPEGSELFYRSGPYGREMMAVDVEASEPFEFGERRRLFFNERASTNPALVFYDVSADGQRFLMAERGSGQAARGGIVVIVNWFEELRQRVPGAR